MLGRQNEIIFELKRLVIQYVFVLHVSPLIDIQNLTSLPLCKIKRVLNLMPIMVNFSIQNVPLNPVTISENCGNMKIWKV